MFPPCGTGRSPWPRLHSSSPSDSGREGCAPTTLCCWSRSPWCPWSPGGGWGAWSPWLGAALWLLSCGFGGAACGQRVPRPLRLPWGPCSQQAMPSPPPTSPTCLTPPPSHLPQQRTPGERWCACCNRCRAHVITHTACRAAPYGIMPDLYPTELFPGVLGPASYWFTGLDTGFAAGPESGPEQEDV